jgi:hypothetical protein
MVSPKLAVKLLDRKIRQAGELILPQDDAAAEMREYGT